MPILSCPRVSLIWLMAVLVSSLGACAAARQEFNAEEFNQLKQVQVIKRDPEGNCQFVAPLEVSDGSHNRLGSFEQAIRLIQFAAVRQGANVVVLDSERPSDEEKHSAYVLRGRSFACRPTL
ncbi:MAG: hypothetical protein ACO1RX_06010 [Candidatus Sericytochromatia bacterium]